MLEHERLRQLQQDRLRDAEHHRLLTQAAEHRATSRGHGGLRRAVGYRLIRAGLRLLGSTAGRPAPDESATT